MRVRYATTGGYSVRAHGQFVFVIVVVVVLVDQLVVAERQCCLFPFDCIQFVAHFVQSQNSFYAHQHVRSVRSKIGARRAAA